MVLHKSTTLAVTTEVSTITHVLLLAIRVIVFWLLNYYLVGNLYFSSRPDDARLCHRHIQEKKVDLQGWKHYLQKVTNYGRVIREAFPTWNILTVNMRNNTATDSVREPPGMIFLTHISFSDPKKCQVRFRNFRKTVDEDLEQAKILDKL